MKKFKKFASCAIILIMALLLCGCMKMHVDVVWNEDNTATVSTTIGMEKTALEMMETTEEDIQQQFRESFEEEGDYTIENFSDDTHAGIIATQKLDDITADSGDVGDGIIFVYTEQGGKKTYTVSGELEGLEMASDGDLTGGGITLEDIDMKISIVMPGTIVSHNATEQDGNKLTWILSGSEVISIEAVSEITGGGLLWLWIVLGAVVLIGGVVVVLLIMRKKKGAAPQNAYNAYGNYNTPGYDSYQAPGVQPQGAAPAPAAPVTGYNPYQMPSQAQSAAPPVVGYNPYQMPSQMQSAPPATETPAPVDAPVYQAPEAQPEAAAPAPVEEPAAADNVVCAKCGAALSADTAFCGVCGTPKAK